MTAGNWPLNSYTNSTWTDLVDATGATVIKAVSIAMGSNAGTVKMRLADSGGSSLAMIVPGAALAANSPYTVDQSVMTLENTQKLQVWCDVAGAEFIAWGAD
jgi:hypothetical protein